MKEYIEFKGRPVDTAEYGNWFYGFYLQDLEDGIVKDFIFNCPEKVEIHLKTLCEFTRMHDKNGKRIYEGDILKDSTGRCRFVVFWNGCWWLKYKGTLFDQLVDQCRHSEIVGNTHDTGSKKL